MEDLDPEPSTRARSVRAREVVLGVLLLVGVLGWAGWQWWHGESLRRNYELGSQAVIAHRWEDARALFDAARGYRDADTRAEEAEKQIEERNKHYDLAVVHAKAGEWVVALQAAQEATAIQPDYKDLSALKAQAESHVYRQALSGTVALRLGDDPGLYYRNADSWVRLENSDQWSDIRGSSTDGTYLYDVPSPGWVSQPTSVPVQGQPSGSRTGSLELAGRRLVAASFKDSSSPTFETLSLDPARYDYYIGGEAGVWGLRTPPYTDRYPGLPLVGCFSLCEITYEAHGSSLTSTVSIAPNMAVTYYGPQGNHLLIAEFDPQPRNEGMSLYLTGPDGSNPQMVYTTTGAIQNALFSPNERYVLVVMIERLEGTSGKMAVVLLDLESGAGPRTLIESDVILNPPGQGINVEEGTRLSANFLFRGYFANKVLVTISRDPNTTFKLIDPEHANWNLTLADLRSTGPADWPMYLQVEDDTLVIHMIRGQESLISGKRDTGTITIVKFDPDLSQWTYLPVRSTTYANTFLAPERGSGSFSGFLDFIRVDDRLVYNAGFSDPPDYTTIFYSVPLSDLGKKEPALTELFTIIQSRDNSSTVQSWLPGSDMLVYTDEFNALHIRTYNGAIDLVLERGVQVVRNSRFANYLGLRR